MFMSVIDNSQTSARYGELAGVRVMITGLSPAHGVDIARAFADHKARLVLQTPPAADPETTALIALLAETAHEITCFDEPLDTTARAQKLAQAGMQAYGSLDVVINLVSIDPGDIAGLTSLEDIEGYIASKLDAASVITQIAANRMRVTMTEGLILTIVALTSVPQGGAQTIIGLVRTALAAMTRREAETWAGNGIRINAIAPRVGLPGEKHSAALASEPEMAAVALYLATRRAAQLSGHIFDAEGSLTRCG